MKESRRAEPKPGGKAAGERSGATASGAKKPAASKSGNGGQAQFQDPHHVASRATRLEAAIGREVRTFRHQLGMTVTQLAQGANMSAGMLSKIENGQTSPSLATLTELSRALQVPVTAFFRRFEEERSATYVKAGPGTADRTARHPRRPPISAAGPFLQPAAGGRALPHHPQQGFRRLPDFPA